MTSTKTQEETKPEVAEETAPATPQHTLLDRFEWRSNCPVELQALDDGTFLVQVGYARPLRKKFDDKMIARTWFESYRLLDWHRDGDAHAVEAAEGRYKIVWTAPQTEDGVGGWVASLNDDMIGSPQADRRAAKALAQARHDEITKAPRPAVNARKAKAAAL